MEQLANALGLMGLGGAAGLLPVYLGLLGALFLGRKLGMGSKEALVGLSIGVLVYLFFDLLHEGIELIEDHGIVSLALFVGGLSASYLGLTAFERNRRQRKGSLADAIALPYLIALGIGLHNLGEGLALGASFSQQQLVLSGTLLAGFALHNSTEGFGILGAARSAPLQERDLVWLGLLAGGPTCLGTVISGYAVSPYLLQASYALAAGSLLYAILSLLALSFREEHRLHSAVGLLGGICAMYATSLVLALVLSDLK